MFFSLNYLLKLIMQKILICKDPICFYIHLCILLSKEMERMLLNLL